MNAFDIIDRETIGLGYRRDAIRRDYVYSDLWGAAATVRTVPFAAFTQTPPSYRSAAFAAVTADNRDESSVVGEHKALGAPIILLIAGSEVSVWQIHASKTPELKARTGLDALPRYFAENKATWAPDAIHRAKSIGQIEPQFQLDFVDVGLITAIEGEVHAKLDRLLHEALDSSMNANDTDIGARALFRGVFRLLAAKILIDRGHPSASAWADYSVEMVLKSIGQYYQLDTSGNDDPWPGSARLAEAWTTLRSGLNVANVSADDLAYVYENTLVTPQARRDFGTHSTPRHVAEYIVRRLRLWEHGTQLPRVFEPFAGAGVFLVSALRHMRDGLPHDWTDQQRHDVLVNHIRGSEIDPFACEVAKLSLILADYPNANGWMIEEADLLQNGALASRVEGANVILCNPPFESLDGTQRTIYTDAAEINANKAVFALETALRAKPDSLGFVVPRALLVDRRYRAQRAAIERQFRDVELVSLPDGIFNVSQAETALLIARGKPAERGAQVVRASEVDDRDRRSFAQTGMPSRSREITRQWSPSIEGNLWVPPLATIWQHLSELPTLGSFVEGHWGLRWNDGNQAAHFSDTPVADWKLGVFAAQDHRQFRVGKIGWLDVDPSTIYGAANLPWDRPKILCNAIRLSRRYWRLAAAVDRTGLLASQQFVGFWQRPGSEDVDLDALAAVINSPVINAFVSDYSFDKRFRIKTILNAPIPSTLSPKLGELARQYSALAANQAESPELTKLLMNIDAEVLAAYDLSPRFERILLAAFEGSDRPVTHNWLGWGLDAEGPAFGLGEHLRGLPESARGDWLGRKMRPVSSEEGALVAPYLP